MAMPMIAIELSVMGGMYKNKQYNTVLIIASVLLMIAFFTFIRQQSAVWDKQFLKSMIPHHAAAILMCDKAPITDPEIKQLCESIISNQQSEINEMKRLLTR